jgi:hypothetical protein
MENWLNINQKRSLEWNLTHAESLLCAFYANEHTWVRTRIIDSDGDYLCIAITKLMKELPIIGKSKKNFSISLNSLTSKNIFDKIVDEDNQRAVFYRMNFVYKSYWKYPNIVLASNIETKDICIANVSEMTQLLPNGNTMSILTQLFPNKLEVLPNGNEVLPNGNEVLPNGNLSNKQSNKQSNKHNQYMENDDDSFSEKQENKNNTKENLLRKEFDKLVSVYPTTINNSAKNLALAFGSFSKLTQTQRVDLLKAAKNYNKTKQVQDHIKNKTSNFIQSLNNFITKSFTEFIYGLPENYIFAEEFSDQKISNGAAEPVIKDMVTVIDGKAISFKEDFFRFEAAKKILEADGTFKPELAATYSNEKIAALFPIERFEVLMEQVGGFSYIHKHPAMALAEALVEQIEKNKVEGAN